VASKRLHSSIRRQQQLKLLMGQYKVSCNAALCLHACACCCFLHAHNKLVPCRWHGAGTYLLSSYAGAKYQACTSM
jgi:hypothetical protein